MHIDLNADLGEGGADDEAILEQVSSINVACGWHAGSPDEMTALVRAARRRGLAIGAHPSFPDRANFGRREMHLPADSVRAGVLYQIGALQAIVRAEGGMLSHVKPHGALYNQAAHDTALARCLALAVRDFDAHLPVMGLAGSPFIDILREHGLAAIEEAFADRRYAPGGRLTGRGDPGALIEDDEEAAAQALSLATRGTVIAVDGSVCRVRAATICLHGDGPRAATRARAVRSVLRREGIDVRAWRPR